MGCAAGTICVPAYANIFMENFEVNIYSLTFMAKLCYF